MLIYGSLRPRRSREVTQGSTRLQDRRVPASHRGAGAPVTLPSVPLVANSEGANRGASRICCLARCTTWCDDSQCCCCGKAPERRPPSGASIGPVSLLRETAHSLASQASLRLCLDAWGASCNPLDWVAVPEPFKVWRGRFRRHCPRSYPTNAERKGTEASGAFSVPAVHETGARFGMFSPIT